MRPITLTPEHLHPWETEQWTLGVVGAKAVALRRLPRGWVPRFVVLTTHAYRLWKQDGEKVLFDQLRSDQGMSAFLSSLHGNDSLIARSSSPSERLADRGRYRSTQCEADLGDIVNAAAEVWHHFTIATKNQRNDYGLALVLQIYVPHLALGHLSNERRVSQQRTKWLVEYTFQQGASQSSLFSVEGKEPYVTVEGPLRSERLSSVLSILELLALRDVRLAKRRSHYEWIWDGGRVWVVQQDKEEYLLAWPPGSRWAFDAPSPPIKTLSLFVHHSKVEYAWNKVGSVRLFESAGLRVADLYVLEDHETLHGLTMGILRQELLEDLKHLLEAPIVIRSDRRSSRANDQLLLPRSATVFKIEDALDFLVRTAKALSNSETDEGQYCFIIHRFIPARASAFILIRPENTAEFLVDSLWGLPDGLLYYDHDSFHLTLCEGKTLKVARRVNFKPELLDISESGSWIHRESARPWDWLPSLNIVQIREIAKQARAISNLLRESVSVMFLVGVARETGLPECLPWHFSEFAWLRSIEEHMISSEEKPEITVSSRQDLDELRHLEAGLSSPFSLRLRPMPKLLRSETFLQDLAETAKLYNAVVVLDGSILAHAYYVLAREGVRVRYRMRDLVEPDWESDLPREKEIS